MTDICEQCGNEYKSVAAHWNQSNCERPSFTDQQREIITGLLMGDGCIHRYKNGHKNRNPVLKCEMIRPNYLEHIDKRFGIFGNGVSLKLTAEEKAQNDRNSGFNPNAESKNYHNLYQWRSMGHPELQEFADWYSSGKKVWPYNIDITPVVLKHWYCGDGSWDNSGTNNAIHIGIQNEKGNIKKINKIFEAASLPAPNNYNISGDNCILQFTKNQSEEIWEYMGEPLPDFEYKWPEEYRSE